MKFFVINLFSDEFMAYFSKGIFKRALDAKKFQVTCIKLREFADPPHYKVDDYPFGKRHGMILRADVVEKAIKSIPDYQRYKILYTCPKGKVLKQDQFKTFQKSEGFIIISGYYEGLDERLFDLFDIQRYSIGDYVLSSGDLPAMVFIETVARLIPGVIGKSDQFEEDSLISGLLEHPQYTQPRKLGDKSVPDVLISGHHKKIEMWQKKEALVQTLCKKPSLLVDYPISKSESRMLSGYLQGENNEFSD